MDYATASRILTAPSRSTETSCDTPRSAIVTPNSRSMRAMVIGLWVMMMKRVSVDFPISSSRSQKRSTLWSSSGASTSSSTQIGAGLVRNTAKISASAVSACSPPESSDSVAGFLPGRLRQNFEAGFERIVVLDELQLRGAAAEQLGEQALEVRVDDGERRQQALARLAIEALDAEPQPLDRLDEIVALGDQRRVLGLDLAQLLLGAQIDGAETLAVALELVEVGFDFGDVGQRRVRFEAGETGERFRLGLQDLADFRGEVGEPPLHRLVTLLGARGGLAGGGERVVGGARGTIGLGECVLTRCERLGGGAPRAFRGFDLGDQRALLRLELGRRVDERSMLGPRLFEARLDGRDL